MKTRKKLFLWILTIILLAIILVIGIFGYPIIRWANHQDKIRESLTENTFYKFPIIYGKSNHFLLKCQLNDNYEAALIIDTKATNHMREDSILKYGGEYWGKIPLQNSNAYQQKSQMHLYSFHSLRCGDMEIKSLLFTSANKENMIYGALNEGIWGYELLSIGCWKFDTENNEITVFSSSNLGLLKKETAGMKRIENGLEDNSIPISIGQPGQEFHFTLDLEYSGVIEINNKLADLLKQHYSYRQIGRFHSNGATDTLTIFDNIPISLAGIEVEKCQLININSVNENFIGAQFMKNFNFLLMYGKEGGHHLHKHQFSLQGFKTIYE